MPMTKSSKNEVVTVTDGRVPVPVPAAIGTTTSPTTLVSSFLFSLLLLVLPLPSTDQMPVVGGGSSSSIANAAPPFAIIAEELGYFPVSNPENGDMMYVPKRISRASSTQAIQLAKKLGNDKVTMYGTYWCPHCARQKELFGKEAFQYINYVECAPKGYRANPRACLTEKVDGYPTWVVPNGKNNNKKSEVLSGEVSLDVMAKTVGYTPFNIDLEQNVPPLLGSASCGK